MSISSISPSVNIVKVRHNGLRFCLQESQNSKYVFQTFQLVSSFKVKKLRENFPDIPRNSSSLKKFVSKWIFELLFNQQICLSFRHARSQEECSILDPLKMEFGLEVCASSDHQQAFLVVSQYKLVGKWKAHNWKWSWSTAWERAYLGDKRFPWAFNFHRESTRRISY